MIRKKIRKPVQIARLLKNQLPEEFALKRGLLLQYQQFFLSQESDAIFKMVKVTNVTDQFLHVTVPNSALSAYLRLHSDQIRQLILQNFGVTLTLKISTQPESSTTADHKHNDWLPEISQASCDQIVNAADYVDDEGLSNALKSLSKTLSKNSH